MPPDETAGILARVIEGEKLDPAVYTTDVLTAISMAVDGHPRDAITTLEAVIARVEASGVVKDKIPAFIAQVVHEEAGERPEAQVGTYLLGVYRGKFTMPIDVLKRVHRHGSFLDHVIQFHSHTLYYTFGRKLREPDKSPWYRLLDEQFDGHLDVNAMVDIMDLFVQASARLNAYQTDGYYDMLNVTLQAARRCKAE